jgi:hypothetical protein
VVIGLAVIAMLILDELTGTRWRFWRARPADTEATPDWRPEQTAARALLAEADAFAARGDYAAAAHLLLERSVEDLSSRRPDVLRPSSTARELARSDLPEAARRALARIVRGVEISLFGGAALGEPDWRECRRAYEEFAFESHWQ